MPRPNDKCTAALHSLLSRQTATVDGRPRKRRQLNAILSDESMHYPLPCVVACVGAGVQGEWGRPCNRPRGQRSAGGTHRADLPPPVAAFLVLLRPPSHACSVCALPCLPFGRWQAQRTPADGVSAVPGSRPFLPPRITPHVHTATTTADPIAPIDRRHTHTHTQRTTSRRA